MADMDLLSVLPYIPPSELNYQDWVNVGMALKEAGYTWQDWDDWSRLDLLRYHSGECRRKWDSFHGSASPITGATIVQMAKDRGWRPQSDDGPGYELGWDDIIGSRDGVLVDQGWLEGKEVHMVFAGKLQWLPTGGMVSPGIESGTLELTGSGQNFVDSVLDTRTGASARPRYTAADLTPVLETVYDRVTLTHDHQRLTCDLDIEARNGRRSHGGPRDVLVETKSAGGVSIWDDLLQQAGIREHKVSKYCVGALDRWRAR